MTTVNIFAFVVDSFAAVAMAVAGVHHLRKHNRELGVLQLAIAGMCAGFAGYAVLQ